MARDVLVVAVAVAEKVSALQTADFFLQRAGQSSKGDLAKLLLKVKNRPPTAGDELPQ
jgi:hypothetical protein